MKLLRQTIGVVALGCGFGAAQAQQGFDDSEPGGVTTIDAVAGASASASTTASASAFAAATLNETRTWLQTGVASWYGDRFHGRTTASGEAFDMNALTAAHPKLAFGSWVRVRNLLNGRSVDVRINDRGPHIKQRVIDLSRAAAEALGLAGEVTRQVEITLLDTFR
ncbi:MAG: septal ring lytic transglycosylase RlpA family protein [Pseudomonadota bacterium]|nr:septal ring lytic transglycosylase RlpA family protein [Pseudomonadota bacterium]